MARASQERTAYTWVPCLLMTSFTLVRIENRDPTKKQTEDAKVEFNKQVNNLILLVKCVFTLHNRWKFITVLRWQIVKCLSQHVRRVSFFKVKSLLGKFIHDVYYLFLFRYLQQDLLSHGTEDGKLLEADYLKALTVYWVLFERLKCLGTSYRHERCTCWEEYYSFSGYVLTSW